MSSKKPTTLWAEMYDSDEDISSKTSQASWKEVPPKMGARIQTLTRKVQQLEAAKQSSVINVLKIHVDSYGDFIDALFPEIHSTLSKKKHLSRNAIVGTTANVVSMRMNGGNPVRFFGKDISEYLAENGIISYGITDSSGNEKFELLSFLPLKKTDDVPRLSSIKIQCDSHPMSFSSAVASSKFSKETLVEPSVQVSHETSAEDVKAFLSKLAESSIESLPDAMKELREIEAVLATTLSALNKKRETFLDSMRAASLL